MAALPFIVGLAFVAAFAPQVDAATPICSSTDSAMCDTTCRVTGYCLGSQWIEGYRCSTGEICIEESLTKATCVSPTSPNAGACAASTGSGTETTFCVAPGTFPSLIDCTLYFKCTDSIIGQPNVPAEQCLPGTYFNSCRGECVAGTCSNNASAVLCTGLNTYTGVDPNNNALYYRCYTGSNRFPFWHSCPSGQVYSTVSNKCLSMSGCSPCTGVGTLPISTTTCTYAYCYGRGNFEERSCTRNFHYDANYRGCVSGGCT